MPSPSMDQDMGRLNTTTTNKKTEWNNREQNLDAQFVSPMCSLATILGLVPINELQNNCAWIRKRGLARFYAVFLLILISVASISALIGRIYDFYPTLPTSTIVITDSAVQLSTFLTNVVCVWASAFCYYDCYEGFVSELLSTTSCMYQALPSMIKRRKLFYIGLFASHLILFLIFVFDAYIWINFLGMKVLRHYIFRDIQNYQLYMLTMVMHNFALTIRHRFEGLNEYLKDVLSSSQIKWVSTVGSGTKGSSEKMEKVRALRKATRVYEMLIGQVNYFNKFFGWQILFETFTIMMGLLNSLNLLTAFPLFKMEMDRFPEGIVSGLVVLALTWTLWTFSLVFGLTACCCSTIKEAEATSDICFNLLLKLPADHENYEERSLKRELNLLKQLVAEKSPKFSAAGFFNVNNSLLLALFGSVTSYIVVLIQFNK